MKSSHRCSYFSSCCCDAIHIRLNERPLATWVRELPEPPPPPLGTGDLPEANSNPTGDITNLF